MVIFYYKALLYEGFFNFKKKNKELVKGINHHFLQGAMKLLWYFFIKFVRVQ
jgi:hypothetical protein